MEKASFKVGQLAEMRTFEDGFRSAWFRCKINDIKRNANKILLDYIDFELEEPSWVEIYQMPPYARKSKHFKRQLMVRPQYPAIYYKDQMPPLNSISQESVVIHGKWKVGNMVDWFKDDCFWSARVVKLLSNDKVQVIELPLPPVGEGKEGEDRKLEALCKDLRPCLDWSETKGWTFHIVEGQTLCDAKLITPTKQGTDLEVENAADGPANASSTTCIPTEGDRDRDSAQNENAKMDLEVEHAADGPVNASSTTRIPTEGDRDGEQNENAKMDCGLVESSESVSSLRVEKRKAAEVAAPEEVEKRELNIMREDTLEAAMVDLEELVNKVNWLQRLIKSPATTSSSWKFA
ncbi:uncharacterized protein LOC110895641 isoform X1 [Helianthus annuus]|uniref:uncharacterized protein LOC110895641 isoform X1 n=1 Tax=Helianthus annuus TaxID=4232 RepID=UPI000B8FE45C|nr:uncharacterized protein LOC110895641 isoform X1 [Helianthus annuus]